MRDNSSLNLSSLSPTGWQIWGAFVGCSVIWGSTWSVIPFQLGTTPIPWTVAIRFGLSTVLTFAILALRRDKMWLPTSDHRAVAILGLCLFSANYTTIYHGSQYLTSGLVAVIFAMLAIFNIINGRIFLRRSVQPVEIIAALMGAAGLAIIFWPEVSSFSPADKTVMGVGIVLMATLIASFGNTALASGGLAHRPVLLVNAWGMFYGTLFNCLFALIDGSPFVLDTRPAYWWAMAYLAPVGTVLSFALYTWLVAHIGVARAGYVAVMTPLVALTISVLFEGLAFGILGILGVAAVLGGNVLINRQRSSNTS